MWRFSRASGRPDPIGLADRARDAKQWDAAVHHYRTALARNPYDLPIWVQYGHALKEGGNYAAAEAAYRRAIAGDPAADSYLQLGHVLKLQGRIEEAKAAYLRALSIDRSLHDAAGELAALGCSASDLSQLLRDIPAPVAADKINGLAAGSRRQRWKKSIITRADRARDLGRWEIAAWFYRNALARNPQRADARQPLDAAAVSQSTQVDEQRSVPAEIYGISETTRLKSIAYITNGYDIATMRYRVYNYADAFRRAGIAVTTADFEEVSFADVADADIVVFCRVMETPVLCEIIARFQSMGRPIIYDIDDLIFDPERIEYLRAAKRWGPQATAWAMSLMTGTLAMMQHFNLVTVATFALKLEVERLGKVAHVIPNTLAPPAVRPGDGLAPGIPSRSGMLRIIYLSGTATHEDDFAVCQPALLRVMTECDDCELLIVGPLDAASEFECFGERLIRHPFVPHETMLDLLQTAAINLAPLEPGNPFTNCKSELKVFEAACYGIPTIASPVSGYGSVTVHGGNGLLAVSTEDWYECLSMLRANPERRAAIGREARRSIAPRFLVSETVDEAMAVYSLACSGHYRKPLAHGAPDDELPTVTVVAPLLNKPAEVTVFLESLRRQSYRGRYEVVLVDDCTRDASVGVFKNFRRYQMTACDTNPNMRVRIIRAAGNAGNGVSQNAGIRESDGEIVVVVDADCMFNRDFLALHAQAYADGDCDVATGPIGIETNGRPPLAVLNAYEIAPNAGDNRSAPLDPMVRGNFGNCITRNFSIRRCFLANLPGSRLFDEEFGYSADPEAGFCREDVQIGYRLCAAGARIKYIAATASIHVSHASSAENHEKPLRSLRNLQRVGAHPPSAP